MAGLTGRCLCGAVRWASPGPVPWAGHCHCESCRRVPSSPFTSVFGVPRDSVSWKGALTTHPTSQGRVLRRFCRTCGSQMTCQVEGWPDEIHLHAATLDDPARFVPRAHYHRAERLPWLTIADDLPRYPGSAEAGEP